MRNRRRIAMGCWAFGALAIAWSQPTHGGGLPVVFVPGTGGTRLVEERADGDRRVWIAPSLLEEGAIERMKLTREGRDGSVRLVARETLLALELQVSMELRVSDPEITRPE